MVGGKRISPAGVGERYAPEDCVLVVIDVQNDFCHPQGRLGRRGVVLTDVHAAVKRILDLISVARAVGVPVLFVRTEHNSEVDHPRWLYRRQDRVGGGFEAAEQNARSGTWGAELFQVQPVDGEMVVCKHRYSAFSSQEFTAALDRLGRPSLIFVGVESSVCVDASAKSALDRDYFSSMVEDACGYYYVVEHSCTMRSFRRSFGGVISTNNLIARWEGGLR